MYKNIACVLIYLCITLPTVSFAEALKKYSVPQQSTISVIQQKKKENRGNVSEAVYKRFKEKIKDYSQADKDKLVEHFRTKINVARQEKNKNAVAYYQRLIGILKTDH